MRTHIYLTSTLTISLVLLSLFFLSRLTLAQSEHLMPSSKYRFVLFLAIHLYIVAMMVLFVMCSQTYSFVRWAFWMSFGVAAAVTGLEIWLRVRGVGTGGLTMRTVMPTELAYLNCYFLVYMYALICCFLTLTFLTLTHCCIYIQAHQIRQAIRQSIHPVPYTPALQDKECSICITKLETEQQLLQIKCKHVFHQDCLLQWIRINQTCPTCRFDVFGELNREDVGVEIVREQERGQGQRLEDL